MENIRLWSRGQRFFITYKHSDDCGEYEQDRSNDRTRRLLHVDSEVDGLASLHQLRSSMNSVPHSWVYRFK